MVTGVRLERVGVRRQARKESFAFNQLRIAHKFIGLVRLGDAAGAAHHAWNSGATEQPCLGSKGDKGGVFLIAKEIGRASCRERVLMPV